MDVRKNLSAQIRLMVLFGCFFLNCTQNLFLDMYIFIYVQTYVNKNFFDIHSKSLSHDIMN